MPFFQVDDDLPTSSKVRTLAYERSMCGDLTGFAALGVWTVCGAAVQASLTDGVVSKVELIRTVLDPQNAELLANLLVEAGLWHQPGHECPRCPPVADGTYLFHDWFDLRYDHGAQVKTTRRKRGELKNELLVQQVWARDCTDPQNPTIGRCRYCGVTVRRQDRKSEHAPEMDHVDPALAIGARNVVLACRTCNRKKGRRTPEEAGMTLRPAPEHPDLVEMVDSPRVDAGSPLGGSDAEMWGSAQAPVDQGPPPEWAVDPEEVEWTRRDATQGRPTPPGSGPPPEWAVDPEEVEWTRRDATQGRPAAPGSSSSSECGADSSGARESSPPRGRLPDQSRSDLIRSDPQPCDQGKRPESNRIRPDQTENQFDLLSRPHARPRVGARGHGQGQGLGKGPGPGSGSGDGQGAGQGHRRRRRKRSRSAGAGSGGAGSRVEVGEPPAVDPGAVPGRFGSAWYRHTGPPSSVGDETTCLEHGVDHPCWKCEEEQG